MPPSFLSALIVGYVVTVLWPDKELENSFEEDLLSIDMAGEEQSLSGHFADT